MIPSLKDYIKKSDYIKNILTLMTGTTISQIIPIVMSPIFSRIYRPEDFGVLALFMSFVGILSVIAAGRYDLAIMLPKDDKEAINIIVFSLIIVLSFSIAVFIGIIVFNNSIVIFLKNEDIKSWLFFVPLCVFITGIFQVFNFWYSRKKQFKLISVARVTHAAGTVATRLGLGLAGFKPGGLIVSTVLGQSIASVMLVRKFFKEQKYEKIFIFKKDLLYQAKNHSDFPKYSVPIALLDVFSQQVPILMITRLFTISVVGLYSFAYRILNLPMTFIGTSVSQVFYQKFSDTIKDGENGINVIMKTWVGLAIVGFVPLLVIFLFGEKIFAFVFGTNWHEAGKIASILSPMVLLMFISSPTSTAYAVLRIQHIGLIFGAIVFVYRPLTFYIGSIFDNIYIGLKILVILETIQTFCYNLVVFTKIKNEYKRIYIELKNK